MSVPSCPSRLLSKAMRSVAKGVAAPPLPAVDDVLDVGICAWTLRGDVEEHHDRKQSYRSERHLPYTL